MFRSIKRGVALLGAAALLVSLTACMGGAGAGSGDGGGDAGSVGISMPTKDNERWVREAGLMTDALAEAGYSTDVQFANNDVATQVSQLENMIAKGAKALIITSIDGSALTNVLDSAKEADIPVFAYTRLLMNSDAVDYYTTFDYYEYGKESALSIARGMGLLDANDEPTGAKGPFYVEAVAGSPTDNVARYQFDAFMDVFEPFIADGSAIIGSGQDQFDQVATLNWDGQRAQTRIEDIIASTYSSGKKINAVWVPYDGMTRGVISALQDAGYEPGTSDWPYLPGGDAEIDSVKAILNGEQYSTVFTDYRELASTTASMVLSVLNGETPDVQLDTETYDNGTKVVPAVLVPVQNVTKDTVQSLLVDSGFYSAADLGL